MGRWEGVERQRKEGEREAVNANNVIWSTLVHTCPPITAVVYFGGKIPENPNVLLWKMAENTKGRGKRRSQPTLPEGEG